MKKLGVTLTLVLAGLAAAVSVARPASTDGTLQASVGPGYTISLTQNGTKVSQLDPGTYTIQVNDQSAIHDFHLTGPGVNESTDIEGTGATSWTVTFTNGTYTYMCDAHPTQMKGTFTVGTAPAPTTTTGPIPPTAAPLRVHVASARFVKPRTVVAALTATRRAALTATLWKGHTKLATAHATAAKATVRLVAKRALGKGSYAVKVSSGSAVASKAVVLR
jgi:plastocyanin